MIGHVLALLTPFEEDAVLIEPMGPYLPSRNNDCLMMVIMRSMLFGRREHEPHFRLYPRIVDEAGTRFDALCHRFGTERITAVIRNRILTNRAWRVLAPIPSTTSKETLSV